MPVTSPHTSRPASQETASGYALTSTKERTMTRRPRTRSFRLRPTAFVAVVAAVAAVVGTVAAPATAAVGSPVPPDLASSHGVLQASADPWGTKAALDANCFSNGLEHRVAFILHAEDSQTIRRYRVFLNHGDGDPVWHPIQSNEAPQEGAPLTDWTHGDAGPYTRLFGWAPQPNERMWHRYAVGYQVLLQQGGWSDAYIVEASYMQDGAPVYSGCYTN